MTEPTTPKRCGFVAILGIPNAGKSTLLNQLVGTKLSIITPKVQTTRVRLRGLCIEDQTQIVFIDTPGIFAANKKFEKGLVQEAWAGLEDADAVLLMIDAKRGVDEDTAKIVERLESYKLPKSLVINKVDEVEKPYLLKLATVLSSYPAYEHIFMISALKGDGVDDMRKWLAGTLPEGEWHYPEDHLTDTAMRDIAAELTREKLFLLLRQELPYSLQVVTEKWDESGKNAVHIMQQIVVERESQKKIVIGNKGETIKRVGIRTRMELEKMLERKVHLELFVKVDPNWKDKNWA